MSTKDAWKEGVQRFFGKEPDPKELVRKWQSTLRSEQRQLDRQIRDIQWEIKKVQKSVKECAKSGNIGSAKMLAKEIVRSNKAITRLTTNKAHMMAINNSLTEQLAMVRVAGALNKSTGVMTSMNQMIKLPEMQRTMMEMSREMAKAGLIDEALNDTMDGVMDGEDVEEEMDDQINQVLDEIAGDTLAAMPNAKRNQAAAAPKQEAEEDEEEDKELQARLQAIKTA